MTSKIEIVQEGVGIGLEKEFKSETNNSSHHETDVHMIQHHFANYGIGAQILAALGVRTMRLLTNTNTRYGALGGFGLHITDRVSLEVDE